jgi:hypothetical protein
LSRRPIVVREGGIALLPLAHRRRGVEPQRRDDRVQRELGLDVVVHEEGLRDRRGVGEAGRLDDDCVELRDLGVEILERHDEVSPHRAADATVHHLDDLLVRLFREDALVDADVAKLVLDDREPQPVVRVLEDVVEKRRLSAAEETGEDGDGNLARRHVHERLCD